MLGARIRRPLTIGTFLLAMAALALPAHAQTGGVRGRVVDAKKQPVQGATVTIEGMDGGSRKFQLKSDRRGEFIQIGLQPGPYRISVEKDGLADIKEQRISLDTLELTFTLAPGAGGGAAAEENSAEAYTGLASLYNAQKKFEQAAEASAQAQKLSASGPGGAASASAVFNQGVIAWNASRIPDAKKSFQEAVRLDPNLADAHYWLGMANLNEGNMDEAAKSFESYLKLAPTGQYAEQAKGILSQIKK